jgi:hypothetical protein
MRSSRLKRWLHVVAAVACAAGSIACAVAAWHRPATVKGFTADAEVKDAGVLKQQEEKDVTFRLDNDTKTPVEIVRVSTSCTCTRAETAARNLQPGESTELTAHLRVGSLRGQVAASVNVLYRAGDGQALERLPLTITATVEPHYTVTPEEVVFERGGNDGKDLRREVDITIVPNGGPALRILEAYSTHPAVRVEKARPDAVADSTTIHLIFDPARCIAPSLQAEIVVSTDSKMEPIRRVPVRVVSKSVP